MFIVNKETAAADQNKSAENLRKVLPSDWTKNNFNHE